MLRKYFARLTQLHPSHICPSLFQYQKISTNTALTNITGKFRSHVWDPALIISQIIAIQCIYYLSLGLLCVVLLALGGYPPSLSCLFDFEMVHIYTKKQQLVLIAHLLNSLSLAITLWYIVQRAKQCWDFTCTLHFFHLLVCCIYIGKFPASLTWWLTQLVCIILIVVISEYLCFKSDMKDIPLVGSNKADVWTVSNSYSLNGRENTVPQILILFYICDIYVILRNKIWLLQSCQQILYIS